MRENIRYCSLVAILAGLVLSWVAHGRSKARQRLETSGIEVVGLVVDATVSTSVGKHSGSTFWLRVTYLPEETDASVASDFQVTESFFNRVVDGDLVSDSSVPVVYAPDNPKDAIIRGGSTAEGGFFVVILMILISGVGLAVFLLSLIGGKRRSIEVKASSAVLGTDWLAQVMGGAPRAVPLFEQIWVRLKCICVSSFRQMIDRWALGMRCDGMALWAVLIKANRKAYDPSAEQSVFFGMVLLAPNFPARMAGERLLPVADWIKDHRGMSDPEWSPEVAKFLRWVDNDVVHRWEEQPVPSTISGGLRCVVATGVFRKKDMLGGALALDLMPVLYSPEHQAATLVPPRFWPSDFRSRWLNQVRQRAENLDKTEDDSHELAAFEVTGLPPPSLAQIEVQLEQEYAANGVECLFLNLGSLQDEDGASIPASGDLHFLGRWHQWGEIVVCIKRAIAAHVPDPEGEAVDIRNMTLDEFFERFDWLLAEFDTRQSHERS